MKRRLSILALLFSLAAFVADGGPARVTVDLAEEVGPIKRMNGVGNGPVLGRPDGDSGEKSGNGDLFKALEIPYCRTHDSNSCMIYGSPYIVDITAVFPDFDADEEKPENYRFACTDVFLGNMFKVGSKPFYRLGQTFNYTKDKASVQPPKDFAKWARICEHIIRHYNDGWADGFHWNIEYWEVWNEPECYLDPKKSSTWGGTDEQFFQLYEITAKHLKKMHPQIRIGGPALSGREPWGLRFLDYQQKAASPLDFFSWHIYCAEVEPVTSRAVRMRKALDERGFTKTESILNEWNYNRSFLEGFATSIRRRKGGKGAAFAAAVMTACQQRPVDMLMYYDVRPVTWNGIFDGSTPLKAYWTFWAWKELVRLGREVRSSVDAEHFYAVAAKDARGRTGILVTRYRDDENDDSDIPVEVRLQGGVWQDVRVHLTDEQAMNGSPAPFEIRDGVLAFMLPPRSFAYIENR